MKMANKTSKKGNYLKRHKQILTIGVALVLIILMLILLFNRQTLVGKATTVNTFSEGEIGFMYSEADIPKSSTTFSVPVVFGIGDKKTGFYEVIITHSENVKITSVDFPVPSDWGNDLWFTGYLPDKTYKIKRNFVGVGTPLDKSLSNNNIEGMFVLGDVNFEILDSSSSVSIDITSATAVYDLTDPNLNLVGASKGATKINFVDTLSEICDDLKDNDNDQKVDCLDPDCFGKKGPNGFSCCFDGSYNSYKSNACTNSMCDGDALYATYQCYECHPKGEWGCEDTGNSGKVCFNGKCVDKSANLIWDIDGDGIEDIFDDCKTIGAVNKVYLGDLYKGCLFGDIAVNSQNVHIPDGCVNVEDIKEFKKYIDLSCADKGPSFVDFSGKDGVPDSCVDVYDIKFFKTLIDLSCVPKVN
jgi:hypothetical protein